MLRFYLDSADLNAAAAWLPTGLFYGVTSNPLLLDRAGLPNTLSTLKTLIHAWHELKAQEIQVQVWGADPAHLLANAAELLAEADPRQIRLVIKVPATEAGFMAAQQLHRQRRAVTVTAVYTPHQALLAHLAGADYLAPYLGRMTDHGLPGLDHILTMQRILTTHQSQTRILVASLRSLDDMVTLAAAGVSCFTMSPSLAEQLWNVPLTQAASQDFEAIAARARASL